MLVFKSRFDKFNLQFGFGPYISYGIGGNIDLDMYVIPADDHDNYSERVRWKKYDGTTDGVAMGMVYYYGYSQIKRLDYGTPIRFGLEYLRFLVNAEYMYGLSNIMWEHNEYQRMNNTRLGMSLTYYLIN